MASYGVKYFRQKESNTKDLSSHEPAVLATKTVPYLTTTNGAPYFEVFRIIYRDPPPRETF